MYAFSLLSRGVSHVRLLLFALGATLLTGLVHPHQAAAQAYSAPAGVGDVNWDSRFALSGLNGTVRALAVAANGDIVVGGDFTDAGGIATADYLARWDGTSWQAVGGGLNGPLRTLVIRPNGDIIVSGAFTNTGGGVYTSNVARWTGISWQGLGSWSGELWDMAGSPNGDVVAAGNHSGFYDDAVQRLDAAGWGYIGHRFYAVGTAVTVAPNGDVILGGFMHNSNADYFVQRWDGISWQELGPTGLSFGTLVAALAIASNGDVLASSGFSGPGDLVMRWDGTNWFSLGTGIGAGFAGVEALAVAPNGDVLIGGNFTDAGGNLAADNIARWDGTSWQSLGTGLNGTVRTLAVAPNGDIVVGGDFTAVGDSSKITNHFAIYHPPVNPTATSALSAAAPKLTLIPNPATAGVVRLTLPGGGANPAVTVLDGVGRAVRRATLGPDGQLDVRGLMPGVYTLRVGAATARLVIE